MSFKNTTLRRHAYNYTRAELKLRLILNTCFKMLHKTQQKENQTNKQNKQTNKNIT
jgi:hypothetical protein